MIAILIKMLAIHAILAAVGGAAGLGTLGKALVGGLGGDLTPMASGGIVTSPTRALVGEAGPEAVIPLNQLGNMNQKVVVEGKIRGRDIWISNSEHQNFLNNS